eukprot:TRINITY_DN9852_c0_g1_i2.p1 TRINITY_DN9852_c0_g1~~TRINITY_DN9852_c0_g1_i2.p1  ORF type:complete len:311 (-),score=51.13 TRINITY_DN9852_c0_g1_i2:154-1086(-)
MPWFTFVWHFFCSVEQAFSLRPIKQGLQTLQVGPPIRRTTWQTACVVSEVGGGVMRCSICNRIEFHEDRQHTVGGLPADARRWVFPCRCHTAVHRACFEKRHIPTNWFTLTLRNAATLTQTVEYDTLGCCKQCKISYHTTLRPPVSGKELVAATIRDPQAWINSTLTAAVTYCATAVLPTERGDYVITYWILQQTILLMIFFSNRLQGIVNLLYRNSSSSVPFYLKLYCFCIVANACFVLHLLAGLPPAWFVHWVVAPLYFPIAHAMVLIFWHTNYAKRTISNFSGSSHPNSHPLFGAFEIGSTLASNQE